jgi:ferrous iron transport protein A
MTMSEQPIRFGQTVATRSALTADFRTARTTRAELPLVDAGTGAMPLPLAQCGRPLIVRSIHGGRKLRRRLLELGVHPGAQVRLIKNEGYCPLIVAVKEDGRLALGRGMCQKIWVEAPSAPRSHVSAD